MPEDSSDAASVWPSWLGRGSLFRNAIAGFVATGVDFAGVVSLVGAELTSVPIATFLGCLLGGAVNFVLNRFWAFGSDLGYGRAVGRYVVVSGASAALNAALVGAALMLYAGSYSLVWGVVRVFVFVGWNYPLHRFWVFPLAARSP